MCDRATLPPTAPVSWQSCTRFFPGRPDQIRSARALLHDFLGSYPAADDAILLISELTGNAISHSASGTPGGTFTVRARLSGRCLRAEVEDQGSAWDGDLTTAHAPHGLYLPAAAIGHLRHIPRHSGLGDMVHPQPSSAPWHCADCGKPR